MAYELFRSLPVSPSGKIAEKFGMESRGFFNGKTHS
jgi:hypothetical protein